MRRQARSIYTCCHTPSFFISRIQHPHIASLTMSKQTTSYSTLNPIFAPGADEGQLEEDTSALLQRGWTLDHDQMGLEKTYYFKTYTKAQDFVNTIAIRSKSKNHHPTITFDSGSARVHWTTHRPRGLSSKDVFMARYCEEEAKLIGEVDKSGANKPCGPA